MTDPMPWHVAVSIRVFSISSEVSQGGFAPTGNECPSEADQRLRRECLAAVVGQRAHDRLMWGLSDHIKIAHAASLDESPSHVRNSTITLTLT